MLWLQSWSLMKRSRAWRLGMKDFLVMSSSRQRLQLRRPIWIFLLVSFVSVFLIGAYIFPAGSSATCFLFATKACRELDHPRLVNLRPLTDDEVASDVVIKEILKARPVQTTTPKIAFMFLTPGSLPFEKLWEKFFHVRALLFSLYSPRIWRIGLFSFSKKMFMDSWSCYFSNRYVDCLDLSECGREILSL